jgi:hypothetical protein
VVKHGHKLTTHQRALLERFDNLNLMHVMDDSLSYIEGLTKRYDGNLNQFLDEARNKIETGKFNEKIEHKHDPLR